MVHVIKIHQVFFLRPTNFTYGPQAHPFFRSINWDNIHRYPTPYSWKFRHPTRGMHATFGFKSWKERWQPDVSATSCERCPFLRHKIHGVKIMDVCKALAFAVFQLKSPRALDYMRTDGFDNLPSVQHAAKGTVRGRPLVRGTRIIGLGRGISM